MSPTTVYSSRSSGPEQRATTPPVDSPMPSRNGEARRLCPAPVDRRLAACMARAVASPLGMVGLRERGTEHRHDRVTDEGHHGAVADDRLGHLGPVLAELGGQPVGSATSAMLE